MSFTFVQFTDLHLGEGQADSFGTFRAMVDEVNALGPPPEFVIHTGDICVQNGRGVPERYREACQGFRMPIFDVLGNHDVLAGQPDSKALFRKLTGRPNFYSFDLCDTHFVVLDGLRGDLRFTDWRNVVGEIGQEEVCWLESDLRAVKPGTLIIVFSHIPIFSTFPQRHGRAWRQEPAWEIANREELHALLVRYHVRLALAGHFHDNQTIVRDGVVYIATAAVCGRWWTIDPMRERNIDGSPRGYRIVTVDGPDRIHSLYKGIGQPITEQFEVFLPRSGTPFSRNAPDLVLLVNVYDGHEGWRVEGALDEAEWAPLVLTSESLPAELDGLVPGLKDPAPFSCAHLWRGQLPWPRLGAATQALRVRALDPSGRSCERKIVLP